LSNERLPASLAMIYALGPMEKAMNTEFSAELGLCHTYEELLSDCERALEAWSARSEEIQKIHVAGAEVGGEMLRLQARFAKAYERLRRHVEKCENCRLQAKRIRPRGVDRSHAA
jgi:hypothetical protein